MLYSSGMDSSRNLTARLRTPGTVLLDAARPGEQARSLLFSDPVATLIAAAPGEVVPVLAALDEAVAAGRYVAGYLAYEAGYALEPRLASTARADATLPLAWFGVYDRVCPVEAAAVEAALEAGVGTYRMGSTRFGLSCDDYVERLAAIREHIREGDVYQVNFTDRIDFELEGDPVALYRDLRRKQRVAYGAFLNTGTASVVSASPELFFHREGPRIVTRPMKGTVHRGRTADEDDALCRWLENDPKSRAENLMIVDLLRNDLSRVCTPGSVRVPALFATERYETVIQMTSTVEGTLRPGTGYEATFRALFPCGSVTGAPKIRAMQVIEALERAPRGVYCGAVGYAAPGDRAVFNVAIRTVVVQDGRGRMGTGSGIVWDSDAASEYEECLLKARFLTEPPADDLRLIETMRWESGIALLDRHAARLRGSARYFGFPFDEGTFRRRVAAATDTLPAGTAWKVRLTLDRHGVLAVSTTLLPPEPERTLRLTVAASRVHSDDVYCYHKTTRRALYEAAYREARDDGFDEAVFLNERGEVTEGSRSNVFVRTGERLLTPPLHCGLLGGVYRSYLLDTQPGAEEQVLYPDDLARADEVWVCNAVWGRRRAQFESVPVDFAP